ncbi:hypothetical protein N0V90_008503 [Kalmusia sp. IMI 367209]|nr:hypothetical protein N0V90_008503 [Kalmusia sp. IMI 367209]
MAEALGLAASVMTVIDLFVKVGVLCSVYCKDLRTARRDARYILNEADQFTATLEDVKRLLASPNVAKTKALQKVPGCIADCQLQLNILTAKLEQGTRLTRVIWPLKKEEVADIVKRLERCRAAILLDLQINQTTLILDNRQETVLAKLRTAEGASFDAHTDAEDARCHPGTRVDILRQILAWGSSRDDGECIFWLNGMAGTGKSTISRTVAQSFAEKGILGASFFFKRGEGDRSRTAFFFTTIIAQLVYQLPSLAPHVCAAIDANHTINEKSVKDQFDKLIADPIKKLPRNSQSSSMVIVVDALDECDSLEHIRLVIQLISEAKHFTSIRLRFFLTSRPELLIRLGFQDISGKYEDLVLHQMPKPIIEHDITAFLQHQLSKIREDYNKSVTSNRQLPLNWPGVQHIQKLVEMAVPLFIFAATVCRFIGDRRFGGPKDQLARILNHQKSQQSNLDATYLPVMDQLFVGLCESQKREVAEKFKQVVGSIVILASPLSIPSLACLLGLPTNDIEDQLDLFHSVLSIRLDSSTPVRLLHLSFRDFLVDPEKGREQEKYPFWVNEQQIHELLATRCLELLLTDATLKRDVCGLRHPGTCRSEIDQNTVNACLPPEVQYACRYWVYHWRESKCLIRDDNLVHCFLARHLLHWLEALGLLGRVSESISMINDLLDLLDPEESIRTSAFLRDTRRVILSHHSTINETPLQVYYSAIVFVPEQSVVRKTFRDQFPAWLFLPPQVDSDWDACLQTLEGHSHYVRSVAFSPDGKQLASVSEDAMVKIWEISSGECLQTLEDHIGSIGSVAFSSNEAKQLVSASTTGDNTIKVWDINTGKCLQTFEGQERRIKCIALSPDAKLLASSSDSTAKIWNMSNSECLKTFQGHGDVIHSVAFSPNTHQLASSSDDMTIRIWDMDIGECLKTLRVSDWVNSIAFSLNAPHLALALDNCTIEIWDFDEGKCLQTLKGHNDAIRSVTYSPDMKHLASASDDKTVKIWDISGEYMPTFNGHSSMVISMTFLPNMKQLAVASASDDGTVKIWDISSSKCLQTLISLKKKLESAVFSPDMDRLALTLFNEASIEIWDVNSGERLQTLQGHGTSVTFSSDAKQLASSSSKIGGTMKIWNISSGECSQVLEDDCTGMHLVAFSPDAKPLILASGSSNAIKIWDINSGKCLKTLEGHTRWIDSVAFSPNAKQLLLASASSDKTVKIWDVSGGKCLQTFYVDTDLVNISFDTDGSCLHTDIGSIAINATVISPALMEVKDDTVFEQVQFQDIVLSPSRAWITYNSRNIMWLPLDYRPRRSAVSGMWIAVGTVSGRVWTCGIQKQMLEKL